MISCVTQVTVPALREAAPVGDCTASFDMSVQDLVTQFESKSVSPQGRQRYTHARDSASGSPSTIPRNGPSPSPARFLHHPLLQQRSLPPHMPQTSSWPPPSPAGGAADSTEHSTSLDRNDLSPGAHTSGTSQRETVLPSPSLTRHNTSQRECAEARHASESSRQYDTLDVSLTPCSSAFHPDRGQPLVSTSPE